MDRLSQVIEWAKQGNMLCGGSPMVLVEETERLRQAVEGIWKIGENVLIDKRMSVIKKAINEMLDISKQVLKEGE